ncbi:MAG: dockerin type I repeat-containing protein [Clostridiales bacterium]|nr:dockerin type I repeat-containing protein [Clostridiales bacterium]
MRKYKVIIKKTAALITMLALVLSAGNMFLNAKTEAVSFNDINNESVFLMQEESGTCTLVSMAMLLRRTALAAGDESWQSITPDAIRKDAWLEGVGLYYSFEYRGIKIDHGNLNGDITNEEILKELLDKHPEGIVILDYETPHAVLLTDYEDGVFYCADPSVGGGRISIDGAYGVRADNADSYWYVSSHETVIEKIEPDSDDDLSESMLEGIDDLILMCDLERFSVNTGKTAVFNFNVQDDKDYALIVEKDGKLYEHFAAPSNPFVYTFYCQGVYKVYIKADNGDEEIFLSNPVFVNVTSNDDEMIIILEDEVQNSDKLTGDIDLDGIVSMSDVTYLQQAVASLVILDDNMTQNADVNGDGEINMGDITYLQKYLAHLVEELENNSSAEYEGFNYYGENVKTIKHYNKSGMLECEDVYYLNTADEYDQTQQYTYDESGRCTGAVIITDKDILARQTVYGDGGKPMQSIFRYGDRIIYTYRYEYDEQAGEEKITCLDLAENVLYYITKLEDLETNSTVITTYLSDDSITGCVVIAHDENGDVADYHYDNCGNLIIVRKTVNGILTQSTNMIFYG